MPPGGIRTHDLSRRAAADLRLRKRGHWDRHSKLLRTVKNFKKSFQNETKGVGTVRAQTIKEMRKQTSSSGQLPRNMKETPWKRNGDTDG